MNDVIILLVPLSVEPQQRGAQISSHTRAAKPLPLNRPHPVIASPSQQHCIHCSIALSPSVDLFFITEKKKRYKNTPQKQTKHKS